DTTDCSALCALTILKHLKSAHFFAKNGSFSVFCGSSRYAFSCRHEKHIYLTLVSSKCEINKIEVNTMMTDEKIKNSNELEFVVFCIENVAEKLGVGAERVYQAFTEKSDILNGYIVPEYEVLHTQSREYIIDDLLDVMKER